MEFNFISSKEELKEHIGKTVFHVFGLGRRSMAHTVKITDVGEVYYYYSSKSSGQIHEDFGCFGDIGIGSNHNNNRLLTKSSEAEDYLAWCIDRTSAP